MELVDNRLSNTGVAQIDDGITIEQDHCLFVPGIVRNSLLTLPLDWVGNVFDRSTFLAKLNQCLQSALLLVDRLVDFDLIAEFQVVVVNEALWDPQSV